MRKPFYTLSCWPVVLAFTSIAYFIGPAKAQSPLDRLEAGIRNGSDASTSPSLGSPAIPTPPGRQQVPPLPAPPAAQPPDGVSANVIPPSTTTIPTPPAVRPVPSSQRGYLGAIVDDRNELGRGLRVLSVTPGGPADHGGVKPRDLIYGVGGVRVRQMRDITTAMSKFGPGDKVAIDLQRGARLSRVTVQLGNPGPSSPSGIQSLGALPPSVPPSVPPTPPAALGSSSTASERLDAKPIEKPNIIPPPPSDPAAITLPTEDKPSSTPTASGPALEAPDARIETMQKKIDDLEARIAHLEQELAKAQKK